jgi:hypothetical protein
MGVNDRSAWPGQSESPVRVESLGDAVKEGETALCLDCLFTFSVRHRSCPKCGGEQFWLMAKWTQKAPTRTRPVALPFPRDRAAGRPVRLQNAG